MHFMGFLIVFYYGSHHKLKVPYSFETLQPYPNSKQNYKVTKFFLFVLPSN